MAGNGPGLLKYFKPCKKNMSQILLPDSTDPLSDKVDSTAIEEANTEVTSVLASACALGRKCTPYLKLIPPQKAIIGQYAAEHGIVNAICRFQGDFRRDSLKESTIRGWKKAYLLEHQLRRRLGKDRVVRVAFQENWTFINNGRRSR